MVWPTTVVTFSSNVTATEVAVAQAVEVVVFAAVVVVDFELVEPDRCVSHCLKRILTIKNPQANL